MTTHMHYRGRRGQIVGITKKDLENIVRDNRIITDVKSVLIYSPVFLGKRIKGTRTINEKYYLKIQTNTKGKNQVLAFWIERSNGGENYYEYIGNDLSKINP